MAIYIMMKNMDMVDREDLIQWDMRDTRGHVRKIKKKKKEYENEQLSHPVHRMGWESSVY